MRAVERAGIFVTHAQVKGKPFRRLPVILHEKTVLLVPQHGAAESAADPTLKWSASQNLSKFMPLRECRPSRSYWIKIERTRRKESVVIVFPPWTEFKTCLHRVQAKAVADVIHHLRAGFAEMQRLEI